MLTTKTLTKINTLKLSVEKQVIGFSPDTSISNSIKNFQSKNREF